MHLLLLIIVAVVKLLLPKSAPAVNPSVNKKEPKVVNIVEIEDIDKEKISYCRCWRSNKVAVICKDILYYMIASLEECKVPMFAIKVGVTKM